MNRKDLALAAVFAGLYAALGFILQSVAFGPIQVRVADALYPLIAVFGFPCLVGTFLGHLIFNIYGFGVGIALGPLDLLSPILFLPAKYAIQRWGLKAVPLHVLSVALWVPFLLNQMFSLPFWVCVATVGVGETIAEVALGVPLAIAIRKRWK